MIPIADYHLHTHLCGHATGQPEDYVKQAIAVGLKEIGFSDHAPFVTHRDPTITMGIEQLPEYHKMIEELRGRFPQINIKLGIEADMSPGYEDKTKELLAGYPYDYITGSVHHIKSWAFDSPSQRERWNEKDVNAVYRDYFDLLRQSALSGMFDIMAHVDLVKKFGNRPTVDFKEEVAKTAGVFKKTNMVIEINTSGLRKPVGEIYPSLEYLRIYCEAGVPIIFGSDAHNPNEVGWEFNQGAALAKQAGYSKYALFKNRKIDSFVNL